MAEWKLALWKKEWDQYHDNWYWVHQQTGQTRTTEPHIDEYMPRVRPLLSSPTPPTCIG